MEPIVTDVDESVFNLNADWKEFYGDVVEEEPQQMPESLGNPVYVVCFIGAYHGVNAITRHLHSRILLFVNNAFINSLSKRESTVKSSTFGS